MKKTLSLILCFLMAASLVTVGLVSVSAADSISYSFSKTEKGFAEGTITLSAADGTYYLYWADSEKALEGMDTLGKVTVSSGKGTLTMPKQTAIPADAEKLIAIKSASEPASLANCTASKASAVYSIPASKQLPYKSRDAFYTFGSISDVQLANDSYGEGKYPYDETHLAAAFETLAKRDVDFTVSSGDTVNDQNGNQTYAAEYKRYQKILADSSYVMPIYEAIGNHDVATVWNGSSKTNFDAFIKGTGLDSDINTINSGKGYFEITEPNTGDHFIFMAMEGAFYTNQNTQFSSAQLDWLEGLLKKYSGDGKNIFIMEHANIAGWGSGDKLTSPYYYNLGLNKSSSDVSRFIKLMETYKECVIITGHTHLELSAQYNYSDNNGTSSVMMHNSAVGGVRRLINGSVNRSPVLGLSEGYIVEVYKDSILFNGINLYSNEIMPLCSYIIPFDTTLADTPTEPTTVPEATTAAPTTVKTEPTEVTTAPTTTKTEPTEVTTVPTTTKTEPTEVTTQPFSTSVTEPEIYLYGDADLNGEVNINDASIVQKHIAELITLKGKAFTQANVTGDTEVNIRDATAIQMKVADIIDKFPIEKKSPAQVGAAGGESLTDILSNIKQALEKYYEYSSFDQYQALKKALRDNNNTYEELEAMLNGLYDVIEAVGGSTSGGDTGGDITVYFSNNQNWSTVKAYVWGSAGSMSAWSGNTMTYVKTDSQNQKIYSISFSFDDYQNIIFNNGSEQTIDIPLTGDTGIVYYLDSKSSGKWTVKTYKFS